ncbi:transporter [Sphingomonas sp. BN140010]|uniref:Transporter n=1 Tax=Sphingomonas arvum TaxID=2992113 RepID=A0ABT3JGU2_9SPHN|nr:transporter [Sphingomonas sp. BN140010]MCW3798308.1 transporter [Sphingomonas sp. BN140010]
MILLRWGVLSLATASLLCAAPASAEELRELCVDRPGKDTPPCIADVGHAVVEVGAVAYSRDKDGADRTISYSIADTLVRVGVTDRSEVQLGFAPYTILHDRDGTTGERGTVRGAGDLTAAYKYNFLNPAGDGTSVAAQLFVSAPLGKDGIGSGAWEGGLIVPVSFELPAALSMTVDPEVDWRGDEDGRGHHLAWIGVASLSHDLGGGVEGSAELWASLDRDPAGHRSEASADLSLAWAPPSTDNLQFDAEVDLGLTRDTPDVEAAVGVAYRF